MLLNVSNNTSVDTLPMFYLGVDYLRPQLFHMAGNLLEKSALVADAERYNHAALFQAAARVVSTTFSNVAIKIASLGIHCPPAL